jgi:diguanylate cyclase (GGDEF)-like protein
MDYGTYFFTNIASVSVFTICICLLAWYNRRVKGMTWFAVSQVVGLAKLIFQGLEGKVPAILSSMLANELYLVAILLQFMGLYWFVVRKRVKMHWAWTALAVLFAVYTIMFFTRIPYGGNVMNIPFVGVCGVSAWMLLQYGSGPFTGVSRVAAFIMLGEMGVAGYRAMLTNFRYMRPWETVNAHTDPRWLYSLAGMAFLAAFMVMCQLWFLVTELQRELAEQARTDPLTGAMNRRAMEEAALRETARSIRFGYPLCMVVIDIDNFKQLNDTRGHAAGDCALQALVAKTQGMLRVQDMLARTGGEEFAILLPDTPASAGIVAAERIRLAVEAMEVPFENGSLKFTISAGVAQLDPARGFEGMMRLADQAMYEAKEHGRNLVSARLSEAFSLS